jgi:hypothetical protein
VARDSGYQRGEDERCDDGLDETQEDIGEDAKMNSEDGRVEAKLGTRDHRDKDPWSQRSATRCEGCENDDRHPANGRSGVEMPKPGEQASGKEC